MHRRQADGRCRRQDGRLPWCPPTYDHDRSRLGSRALRLLALPPPQQGIAADAQPPPRRRSSQEQPCEPATPCRCPAVSPRSANCHGRESSMELQSFLLQAPRDRVPKGAGPRLHRHRAIAALPQCLGCRFARKARIPAARTGRRALHKVLTGRRPLRGRHRPSADLESERAGHAVGIGGNGVPVDTVAARRQRFLHRRHQGLAVRTDRRLEACDLHRLIGHTRH